MLKIEVSDAGRVRVEVEGTPLRIMAEFGAVAHDIVKDMASEGVPVEIAAYAMAESISMAIDKVLGDNGACVVWAMNTGCATPDIAEMVNRIKEAPNG